MTRQQIGTALGALFGFAIKALFVLALVRLTGGIC